jgi:hypothetical protein
MTKFYIVAPRDNLQKCIDKQLYGHPNNVLHEWVAGDQVFYYDDSCFVGFGVVAGVPYFDQSTVWPDGIYPHRIKVKPTVVLPRESWVTLDEANVRGMLQKYLGPQWVLHAVRGVRPIPEPLAEYIRNLITSRSLVVAEEPVEEFKAVQKEAKKQLEKREHEPLVLPAKVVTEEAVEESLGTAKEVQSHDRMQWYLIKLGRALGCDVWVAKNDQGRSYKGEAFSDLCIEKLPNLGFDSATSRTIENIDVLWLQSNVIQCAFEVEHTTSIYSGLLRLADLVASQPHIKIKLFIVASPERRHQVVFQLNRPVFNKLLLDVCKYIPYDKLESTLAKIEDFQGYLQVGLVEKIAESCGEDQSKP